MGHSPIPPLGMHYAVPRKWRTSIFASRRRRALEACRRNIDRLELELGIVRLAAPPKPSDAHRARPVKPAEPTYRER